MSTPVFTLATYTAKPGCEEELAGVLRTHAARLRELGFLADRPAFAAAIEEVPGSFVETFWWESAGSAQLARDNSEVQELWMRVEDLCVQGGVLHRALRLLD